MDEERTSTSPPETPETAQSPAPELPDVEESIAKRNSSVKWFIIGGALVVFLVLAAFQGARLLKSQAAAGFSGGGQMTFSSNGKTVRLDLIPAKELPQETATTAGLFIRREDQSIFIGTGKISIRAAAGNGGPSVSSSYDGPVVEVVIAHDTRLYQDLTDMDPGNMNDAKNGSEVKIQQMVKPGSLDDLGPNSMVSVWGDKQGDRYIAKVIAFR